MEDKTYSIKDEIDWDAVPVEANKVEDDYAPDKAWAKIHELAGLNGPPNNREERRRVEKVLRQLKKRGLTVT